MEDLNRLLVQVRRISDHRVKGAEQEIVRTFQGLQKELQEYLGREYVRFSKEDRLDFLALQQKGEFARFLEEAQGIVASHIEVSAREMRQIIEQTYFECWLGMERAVSESGNSKALRKALSGVQGITPDVVKRAVENPLSGLTLTDQLQKHRQQVIYGIKQQLGIGLTQGDRYTTMARRVAGEVAENYKKAMTIVRTEVHRVREAGFHDGAERVSEAVQQAGMCMAKTWRTMRDEKVRPSVRYKTKTGWKSAVRGPYNHQKMDGVSIPVKELFDLGNGVKTKAPGQSGVAGQDINCRCFLEYDMQVLKSKEESSTMMAKDGGIRKRPLFSPANSIEEANRYAQEELGVDANYRGLALECANEWNKGLAEMKGKFPEIFRDKIHFVGESHERNKLAKEIEYQYQYELLQKHGIDAVRAAKEAQKRANGFTKKYLSISKHQMASSWSPGGRFAGLSGICLNRDQYKNYEKAISAGNRLVKLRWSPEGCGTVKATFDHEFAHQLDSVLDVRAQPNIQKLFDSRSKQEILENLSEYSYNNDNRDRYAEMVAEGWSEYCNNPSPRPMAEEIGKTIERLYAAWKKRSI